MKEAYIDVAERSVAAADACLTAKLPEKAMFLAYHAFESAGGALCESRGVSYPLSHAKKLSRFQHVSQGRSYGAAVSLLCIVLNSIRNLCLYPSVDGQGSISRPQDVFSDAQARDARKRVAGVVRRVKNDI